METSGPRLPSVSWFRLPYPNPACQSQVLGLLAGGAESDREDQAETCSGAGGGMAGHSIKSEADQSSGFRSKLQKSKETAGVCWRWTECVGALGVWKEPSMFFRSWEKSGEVRGPECPGSSPSLAPSHPHASRLLLPFLDLSFATQMITLILQTSQLWLWEKLKCAYVIVSPCSGARLQSTFHEIIQHFSKCGPRPAAPSASLGNLLNANSWARAESEALRRPAVCI